MRISTAFKCARFVCYALLGVVSVPAQTTPPKPAAYQVRVGVRDVGSGQVGNATQFIEVPKTK